MRYTLGSFWRETDAQFSIIGAIFGMVILGFAGGVIDVTNNYSIKSKLQIAADTAALSGSSAYNLFKADIRDAKKTARDTFLENCAFDFCERPKVTIENGQIKVSSVVDKPNYFLSMLGMKDTKIAVQASSSVDTQSESSFVDVYFVFDISSSLMFPETQAGVDLMEANFEPFGAGGCAFACHADLGGGSGDQIAQNLGVYLREDRMREEIGRISDAILDTANGKARISLISFGWNAIELVGLTDLKSGIDAGILASDYIESSNGTGTNYETAFADLVNNSLIPDNAGSGTEIDPKNVVILVTDGVYNTNSGSTSGALSDKPIDPATCNVIKDTGAELFVLNLNYPDPSTLLRTSANGARLDNLELFYDQIIPNLNACATPGRYFEGRFNTEIVAAFDEIYSNVMEYVSEEELEVRLTQ